MKNLKSKLSLFELKFEVISQHFNAVCFKHNWYGPDRDTSLEALEDAKAHEKEDPTAIHKLDVIRTVKDKVVNKLPKK